MTEERLVVVRKIAAHAYEQSGGDQAKFVDAILVANVSFEDARACDECFSYWKANNIDKPSEQVGKLEEAPAPEVAPEVPAPVGS